MQTGVRAVGIGAELIDAAESLIQRAAETVGSKAAVADILISVELHLVRLMQPTSAYEVGSERAPCAYLLFDSGAVLVIQGSFQSAARKRIQRNGERADRIIRAYARARRSAVRKALLQRKVGGRQGIDGASWNTRKDGRALDLSADPATKVGA